MAIVNRRNAVLGWTVWKVAKRVARRKAKDAVPTIDRETKRPNKSFVFALAGALGGLLLFWRRGGKEDEGTA
jgi:hypothetical protein